MRVFIYFPNEKRGNHVSPQAYIADHGINIGCRILFAEQ